MVHEVGPALASPVIAARVTSSVAAELAPMKLTEQGTGRHRPRVAFDESLVVIGGSCTGKSVLLKCILGFVGPEAGTIRLAGQDVTRLDRQALLARFGILVQGGALYNSLPIWENVASAASGPCPAPRRGPAPSRCCPVWASPPLPRTSTPPNCRAAFRGPRHSCAIAADPEVVFFSEPTADLDPIMVGVIDAILREAVTRLGATAVTITHHTITVRAVADRIAMLHGGHIR